MVDQDLYLGTGFTRDHIEVYITWTNIKGHVLNLPCPATDFIFQCPLKDDSCPVTSGELVIGTNFTALALDLKNREDRAKDLDGNANPLMITLGYRGDFGRNSFSLFPNVHIRATLTMTHVQSIMNPNIAAFGFQKVGRGCSKYFSVADCMSSMKIRMRPV